MGNSISHLESLQKQLQETEEQLQNAKRDVVLCTTLEEGRFRAEFLNPEAFQVVVLEDSWDYREPFQYFSTPTLIKKYDIDDYSLTFPMFVPYFSGVLFMDTIEESENVSENAGRLFMSYMNAVPNEALKQVLQERSTIQVNGNSVSVTALDIAVANANYEIVQLLFDYFDSEGIDIVWKNVLQALFRGAAFADTNSTLFNEITELINEKADALDLSEQSLTRLGFYDTPETFQQFFSDVFNLEDIDASGVYVKSANSF